MKVFTGIVILYNILTSLVGSFRSTCIIVDPVSGVVVCLWGLTSLGIAKPGNQRLRRPRPWSEGVCEITAAKTPHTDNTANLTATSC